MKHLLSTRSGRLFTFFLLYVTEGIPQGFAATALAFQMRKQGLDPLEVGAFVASLYLPWSWKILAGPVVDLIYSDRLGKRRAWIVGCQLMMSLTLLAAWPIDYTADLWLFSLIIIIHNVFAATQDVAIDALAVTVLPESERGVANGFMFAGAYTGAGIGGAGVLYLTPYIGFSNSFWMVAGSILLITVFISMRIREARAAIPLTSGEQASAANAFSTISTISADPGPAASRKSPGTEGAPTLEYLRDSEPQRMRAVDVLPYLRTLLVSMFGNVRALGAFVFALLPTGAFAISLTLRQNLTAEFRMSDSTVANLTLAGTVLAALGCVSGGFLSDRLGRRRSITLFTFLTMIPTLALAWHLHTAGWIMPVDTKAAAKPVVPEGLLTAYIVWSLIYGYIIGLIYGSRTAGYMDVCNPAVAATQFTAYMSLMNLALAGGSLWQGWALKNFGYPSLLIADCAVGVVCLVPLMLMSPKKKDVARASRP